jgi:ribosomal protein S18 acetylase RimI-like enzyme
MEGNARATAEFAGRECVTAPACFCEHHRVDGLTIRMATEADRDRIAAIIDDPPSAQAVAIAGDERRARAAGRLYVRHDLSIQLVHTVVAEIDGEVVGIMDASMARTDPSPSPVQTLRLLIPALRAVGPDGLWRFLRSRPAWGRVSFEPPADDYFIMELDVAVAYRNRGIGAALLRHAEAEARRLGCARMSLTTNITNPAQHLYERSGFRIVDTKRDAAYERWGGSPGRVLMARALEARSETRDTDELNAWGGMREAGSHNA